MAVALLGALTHQAMPVLITVRGGGASFATRFRAVPAGPSIDVAIQPYHRLRPFRTR